MINAAAEIFGEQGYLASTLDEVAGRVGILRGSLYHYIDGKEDLLYAILKLRGTERLEVMAEDEELVTLDAPTRLSEFIRKWMANTWSSPHYRNISETDTRYLLEPRRTEIQKLHAQIGDLSLRILEAGIAEGSFRPDIDPDLANLTLFQLLFTIGRWYQGGREFGWDDVTEWYVQLFLDGMGCRSPQGRPN